LAERLVEIFELQELRTLVFPGKHRSSKVVNASRIVGLAIASFFCPDV
jgi:hypothetical protein